MSAGGVVPHHFTQTGEMDCRPWGPHIVFGAERGRVVIFSDGGDIVLTPDNQDLFARHLFLAMYDAGTAAPF